MFRRMHQSSSNRQRGALLNEINDLFNQLVSGKHIVWCNTRSKFGWHLQLAICKNPLFPILTALLIKKPSWELISLSSVLARSLPAIGVSVRFTSPCGPLVNLQLTCPPPHGLLSNNY